MFKDHHIEILNALKPGACGQKINVQAPRGSAKTTCMAVWFPLFRICYKAFDEAMGVSPEEFILITARNFDMAKHRLRDISRIIEENALIRQDFGDLTGRVWMKEEIETSNGVKLKPNGRGQSPRGALIGDARPTLQIADDLEDPKRCLNPELRDEDEEWFYTDWMFAGDLGENRTNYVVIDTNKHPESLSEKLRGNPDWRTLHYKAIIHPEDLYHPTAEHRWRQWEGFYADMTLDDDERRAAATAFYEAHRSEMIAGVDELWKEKMSYLKVRQLIVERGYHHVMRELQNIAKDPSMALFNMEAAITFGVDGNGFLRSDNRLVAYHEIGGFTTYLDTAGSRDTIDGAFACAVVIAWQPLPGGVSQNPNSLAGVNGYVLAAWLDRCGLTEQMEQAVLLHQRAEAILAPAQPKSNFVVEQRPDTDGSIRIATASAFRAAKEKFDFEGNIQYHAQHQNKEIRIENLEPFIANGWLAFNEKDLPPELWKQFRQFPSADHNDAPDAVQGACRARVTSTVVQRRAAQQHRHKERPKVRI